MEGQGGQSHLGRREAVNLGSFYTPRVLVERAFEMLARAAFLDASPGDFVLLDNACGYGNFLETDLDFAEKIGADIDEAAILNAKKIFESAPRPPKFFCMNSLSQVSRSRLGIPEAARLIAVGNPPYNDHTSIVQNKIKLGAQEADPQILRRDLGQSFLLSFDLLRAEFVCVLHPLSFLIKKSNLRSIQGFAKNYCLLDSLVFSSSVFCPNSLGHFPIVLALYRRQPPGTTEAFVQHHTFKTLEGASFCLSDFESIAAFLDKYPNKKRVKTKVAMFYTLRDINALRRSRTFLAHDTANAVYVAPEKYGLYCYVDAFKKILPHVPYYLGNCDVPIDFAKFRALEAEFIKSSEAGENTPAVEAYFRELLGRHYVE